MKSVYMIPVLSLNALEMDEYVFHVNVLTDMSSTLEGLARANGVICRNDLLDI